MKSWVYPYHREQSRQGRLKMSQDVSPGFAGLCRMRFPRTTPDSLYAALDTSACAAFFTESRMRLIDSNKAHTKSGYVWGIFSRT